MDRSFLRLMELAVLFIIAPLAVTVLSIIKTSLLLMPVLWGIALGCFLILLKDRSFDRTELHETRLNARELRRILTQFAFVGGMLGMLVYHFAPDILFFLPRTFPALWLLILVLYPALSVYPQGIIYRSFFTHRYASFFTTPRRRIFVGAFLFSFMHIVFLNVYAVALTFAGGLLFAYTHEQTKSLVASSIEHVLYGWLVITLGLGVFLLRGTQEFACNALNRCPAGIERIERY